jgi:formylglycine-generating enzyme required for sulfatase activity
MLPLALAAFALGAEPPATNSAGMKLVRVPAGEFVMGSTDTKEKLEAAFPQFRGNRIDKITDEAPHRVRITRPFWIGAHEVTIAQFRAFVADSGYVVESERDGTGGYGIDLATKVWATKRTKKYSWKNPGFPQGDDHPVLNVSYADSIVFCDWLSKKEGKKYRLPTEAEWEYAARAGTRTRYFFGDDPEDMAKYGNTYDASSAKEFPEWKAWAIRADDGFAFTAPVGSFKPNAWGLHDVHGNVWEWTSDWHADYPADEGVVEDPTGPATGGTKARRGGGWHVWPLYCRCSFRNYNTPQSRYLNLGLRVVREDSGK